VLATNFGVEGKSVVIVFDRYDRQCNHFSPALGARICKMVVAARLKAHGWQSLAARSSDPNVLF